MPTVQRRLDCRENATGNSIGETPCGWKLPVAEAGPEVEGREAAAKRELSESHLVRIQRSCGTRVDVTRSQPCQVPFSSRNSHLQESLGGHVYLGFAVIQRIQNSNLQRRWPFARGIC